MTIQVLGPGCKRCDALASVTRQAVAQLGLDTQVEKVTDYAEMARIGVMSTQRSRSTDGSRSPAACRASSTSRACS